MCTKYEIIQMVKDGGGAIVNMASMSGLIGTPNHPAYVASKHGMVGLTKAAALEYAKTNIRVNAACPTVIRTPMVERLIAEGPEEEERIAQIPMGRMGNPIEVAEAVVWLCSDAASFTTGHMLTVDGGWTAQ